MSDVTEKEGVSDHREYLNEHHLVFQYSFIDTSNYSMPAGTTSHRP